MSEAGYDCTWIDQYDIGVVRLPLLNHCPHDLRYIL
jgi:hypothetical protein